MGKAHPHLDDTLRAFVESQHVFFVATAPTSTEGHVNCSPKGGEPLRVLAPNTVAYVDRVGSGVETIAHLRENGRITILLCAFSGPPKIVRLHGRGEVLLPGDAEFERLATAWSTVRLGARSIVRVHVTRVSTSCGFGVPRMDYVGDRDEMATWCAKKGEDGVRDYVRQKNATSLDGLPGLDPV